MIGDPTTDVMLIGDPMITAGLFLACLILVWANILERQERIDAQEHEQMAWQCYNKASERLQKAGTSKN